MFWPRVTTGCFFFNRSPHTSVLCCMSLGTVLWRLPTPFRVMSPTAPKQPSWNCGGSGGSWNRKTNILRVISPRIPCNLGWSWMILDGFIRYALGTVDAMSAMLGWGTLDLRGYSSGEHHYKICDASRTSDPQWHDGQIVLISRLSKV